MFLLPLALSCAASAYAVWSAIMSALHDQTPSKRGYFTWVSVSIQSLKNLANPLRAWQAVLGNASMSREKRGKPENKEKGRINLSRKSASEKEIQGCIVFSWYFVECCSPCWRADQGDFLAEEISLSAAPFLYCILCWHPWLSLANTCYFRDLRKLWVCWTVSFDNLLQIKCLSPLKYSPFEYLAFGITEGSMAFHWIQCWFLFMVRN